MKVIIDCDPGHDDIMAIFTALAHPEEIEILGYTTVCGNNLLDKVTNNLCNVLSFLKVRVAHAKLLNCLNYSYSIKVCKLLL